jgi:pyridoxine 5-phosphate synthase
VSVRLGVNIDHVATLRQQRKEGFPDPVRAALIAQAHGADSIVAHLREDRRHIQDDDLRRLKKKLRIPLAMEMAATDEMVRIACRIRPARVCLVPEKRQELTTEGGLDVAGELPRLIRLVKPLLKAGIEISAFIDPRPSQVIAAKALGAQTVELHTGAYARSRGTKRKQEVARLHAAAYTARSLRLHLHAGHGLDLENVKPVARLPGMQELNIGFAIIAAALEKGLGKAVREMKSKI